MKVISCLSLVLLFSGVLFAQSTVPAPVFDAADVRVSKPGTSPSRFFSAGRVQLKALTMLDLIDVAYGVESDMVLGGPAWLNTDRFDIDATAPRTTIDDQLQLMLRSLLAERFGLAIHRADRPSPIFALTSGKGKPKLKKTAGKGDGCGLDQNTSLRPGLNVVSCQNTTMDSFAERLRGFAAAYLNHPVMNKTALEGAYDFTITWALRSATGRPTDPDYDPKTNVSIFEAIVQQLGLKLEPQEQIASAVVVDRVNQTPMENPSRVAVDEAATGPLEFEVATVKLMQPGTAIQRQSRTTPGGQTELHGFSLKEMIALSYAVQLDRVIADQKWIETDKFEVIGKAPPSTGRDSIRLMIQKLLADQFKLQLHKEDRPVPVYALAMGPQAPKLKQTSGDRSACQKDSLANGGRTLTCKNMPMERFVEEIRNAAPAYFDHPIVDITGLKGAYDFALTWSPQARIDTNAAVAAASPGIAPAPTDDITIFEAVEKYLGLKLALEKLALPALVIDHVEKLSQ